MINGSCPRIESLGCLSCSTNRGFVDGLHPRLDHRWIVEDSQPRPMVLKAFPATDSCNAWGWTRMVSSHRFAGFFVSWCQTGPWAKNKKLQEIGRSAGRGLGLGLVTSCLYGLQPPVSWGARVTIDGRTVTSQEWAILIIINFWDLEQGYQGFDTHEVLRKNVWLWHIAMADCG